MKQKRTQAMHLRQIHTKIGIDDPQACSRRSGLPTAAMPKTPYPCCRPKLTPMHWLQQNLSRTGWNSYSSGRTGRNPGPPRKVAAETLDHCPPSSDLLVNLKSSAISAHARRIQCGAALSIRRRSAGIRCVYGNTPPPSS